MKNIKKIFAKIKYQLVKQNCLLCKQESHKLVCNVCLNNITDNLNYTKNSLQVKHKKYDFYSLLSYSKEIAFLLKELKFHKNILVNDILCDIMQDWWNNLEDNEFKNADLFITIPIHNFRYLYRGFNQTELLIKKFSNKIDKKYDFTSYKRIKYTKSQAKSLKKERQKQIKNVFEVIKPINEKHIIIFDDVFTTGSTIKEFINILEKSELVEINKISILTLVRV